MPSRTFEAGHPPEKIEPLGVRERLPPDALSGGEVPLPAWPRSAGEAEAELQPKSNVVAHMQPVAEGHRAAGREEDAHVLGEFPLHPCAEAHAHPPHRENS